jgi:serine/threonine protein kinase
MPDTTARLVPRSARAYVAEPKGSSAMIAQMPSTSCANAGSAAARDVLLTEGVATGNPKSTSTLLRGKYVLGDCIGEGGMGRVYRAEQPALARVVAIKVMHAALAENPHVAAHFRTEAVAAAGIAHPNSVAVLDYGETDEGVPFLVMEMVEGCTLSQLVRSEAPLDAHRAVTIIVQVLSALEEAHRAGIVHADVKSDNVLVGSSRNGRDQVKLVDFGLARIAREPSFADDLGFISGTPEYMAPEIIDGEPPSPASDIYAAGAMLYELLTGSTPFAGGSSTDILQCHRHDIVVPPSLRVPHLVVPPHVEQAILTALIKEPSRRFTSAAAFASALTAIVAPPVTTHVHHCVPSRVDSDRVITLVLPTGEPLRERSHMIGRGSSGIAIAEMAARRVIGEGMMRGDVGSIVTGYLALAELLRSVDRPRAAIHELEEALDVLPASTTSQILVALVPLYVEVGDHRAASLASRGCRIDGTNVRVAPSAV